MINMISVKRCVLHILYLYIHRQRVCLLTSIAQWHSAFTLLQLKSQKLTIFYISQLWDKHEYRRILYECSDLASYSLVPYTLRLVPQAWKFWVLHVWGGGTSVTYLIQSFVMVFRFLANNNHKILKISILNIKVNLYLILFLYFCFMNIKRYLLYFL